MICSREDALPLRELGVRCRGLPDVIDAERSGFRAPRLEEALWCYLFSRERRGLEGRGSMGRVVRGI